jgi:hypothetical protein
VVVVVVVVETLGRLLDTLVEELPPECRATTKATPPATTTKPTANSKTVLDPRTPAVVRVVGEVTSELLAKSLTERSNSRIRASGSSFGSTPRCSHNDVRDRRAELADC